eukprot:COSAG06_NODE_63581_length_262_cov_0.564417_1_plen_36_part_10
MIAIRQYTCHTLLIIHLLCSRYKEVGGSHGIAQAHI